VAGEVMGKLRVYPVSRRETLPFLIDIHYAARTPSISKSFGLYDLNDLIGVVTYGTPSSAPLRSGICGPDFAGSVVELNRLCLLNNGKNQASFLVSKSIKMIKQNCIIVSYADPSQGHIGIVYQACSFLYCGLSAKRTDWKLKGMEHLHGQTIADEFRGVKNRSAAMREKYGTDFYLAPRTQKHRYIKIIGSKGFRAHALTALRYKVESYPKQNGSAILAAEAST
jgi:hypothetical protein